MTKKERCVIKYLELTYGDREIYETIDTICVNGVCVYYKSFKRAGVLSVVIRDLNMVFGDGRYNYIFNNWFSEKYKSEIKS
jgi:hypothetical protein